MKNLDEIISMVEKLCKKGKQFVKNTKKAKVKLKKNENEQA